MYKIGTLISWNDDRGFGFIEPAEGGPQLFVHISAFARGKRPTVGEVISYEPGRGRDGRPRAVRVGRDDIADSPAALPRIVVAVLVLLILATAGYLYFQGPPQQLPFLSLFGDAPARSATPERPAEPAELFTCDGRVHCSEMTSCREAEYFLAHCPGTKMDGDRDGIPCERQWCSGG